MVEDRGGLESPGAVYDMKSSMERSLNSKYVNRCGVKFNNSKSKRYIEEVMEKVFRNDFILFNERFVFNFE